MITWFNIVENNQPEIPAEDEKPDKKIGPDFYDNPKCKLCRYAPREITAEYRAWGRIDPKRIDSMISDKILK